MPTHYEILAAEREAARLAIKESRWARAKGVGHGPAKPKKQNVETRIKKQQAGFDSTYGAAFLMPDAAGLDHARRVVCANATASYGRTELNDAILLLNALGIYPEPEDEDGCGTKE